MALEKDLDHRKPVSKADPLYPCSSFSEPGQIELYLIDKLGVIQ